MLLAGKSYLTHTHIDTSVRACVCVGLRNSKHKRKAQNLISKAAEQAAHFDSRSNFNFDFNYNLKLECDLNCEGNT